MSRMSGTPASPERPITVLIAALGGEGGGVLTGWLVAAAERSGLAVQSTSIPGVAQRTGATTYYIEMLHTGSERRPVFALTPAAGEVDLMVASELLEAARAVAGGFVSPERTTVIASTHRIFAMAERTAMGDGRLDSAALLKTIEANARRAILSDLEETAQKAGAPLNAVLLGAMIGSGVLPLDAAACLAAIGAAGKSVDSNLSGFQAGLAAVGARQTAAASPHDHKRAAPEAPAAETLLREVATGFPESTRAVLAEGVKRLVAYQDAAYARLYLDRLAPLRDGDEKLLRETARHLALRMSFEDVILVGAAKTVPGRYARIAGELGAAPDEPITIAEFFKPGIEELCSLLPPGLARPILALAARRRWLGRVYWGMEVKTTTVTGYLRLRLLAGLKRWRRRSFRYAVEQAAIEEWLALVREAAQLSAGFAFEIAECATLIKGYGETHQRGMASYQAIATRIIRPALGGQMPIALAADAVASARTAALADPDGESLARCLAEFDRSAPLPAAAAQ